MNFMQHKLKVMQVVKNRQPCPKKDIVTAYRRLRCGNSSPGGSEPRILYTPCATQAVKGRRVMHAELCKLSASISSQSYLSLPPLSTLRQAAHGHLFVLPFVAGNLLAPRLL